MKMACRHDMLSPYSDILHGYFMAYHEYPKTKTDLSEYIENCIQYWGEACFDRGLELDGNAMRALQRLNSNSVMFVAFSDSCFLYDRRFRFGAVLRGGPIDRMTERQIHSNDNLWWRYSPAFFDKEGHVLLGMIDFEEEGEFSIGMKDVQSRYGSLALMELSGRNGEKLVKPVKALMTYSSQGGLKLISCSNFANTYSCDTNDNDVINSLPNFTPESCSEYFNTLSLFLIEYTSSHHEVSEIRFISSLYF